MKINPPTPREVARDVHSPGNPNPKPHASALRNFDVSTFRFFDVSTQKPPKTRHAPTHARRKSCKRPPKLFSPIVTFKFLHRRAKYQPKQDAVTSTQTPRPRSSPEWGAGL
ncbi:hypothetical protein B7486_04635 [cyanobacterium TDX16]|nr:hypothetical protein B7486_04635 [cyanobacterium TDX16]